MKDMTLSKPMLEAIEIAASYNWAPEMPDAVEQMRQGVIPEGFGRLVGQTIALFLTRPVIGWGITEEMRRENRQHGKRLARLRYLIAEMNLAKRRST